MKTLSLTQPYASLIAIGAKKIETRSWYTLYRGPLAIHAAKGFPKWARSICGEPRFNEALWRAGYELGVQSSDCLPVGAVVATCRLVDCKRIVTNEHMFNVAGASSAYRASSELAPPGQPELSFGDYAHGRYAWMLEDIVRMLEPIPAKSRMESKVALLLDKLGWEWKYEPFSVMLDGINYTPDFYAPAQGYVIECRGYDSAKGQKQVERFGSSFQSIEIPGLRPFTQYIVIGPTEALIYPNKEPLGLRLCSHCGRWGVSACICSHRGSVRRVDVTTKAGEVFIAGHAPDGWGDLPWSLHQVQKSKTQGHRDDAIRVLRSTQLDDCADWLANLDIVPVEASGPPNIFYAIDARGQKRWESEFVKAALLLVVGCQPSAIFLEEEVV